MRHKSEVTLKSGKKCLLRSLEPDDAREAFDLFQTTHAETDFLTSYPDENSYDDEGWRANMGRLAESGRDVEVGAYVDGRLLGTVSVNGLSKRCKMRHRAELGISVLREAWGLGIGRALMEAAIGCARQMGFAQLELEVVADNERAIGLYRSLGFVEFGRNPKAFRSRASGWQELVLMRLEL